MANNEMNMTEYNCISCNYTSLRKGDFDKHCKSTLHLTGKRKARSDKLSDGYVCILCNYKTINKLNYDQHILNNHSSAEDKKNKFKYFCEKCNFGINTENLYKKHCDTNKHKIKTVN